MPKKITYGKEAREKLKSGVDSLANAVKVTLGAAGQNVIIEIEGNSPQITKDGVTVAKSIVLEDPIENMGAQLIKDVAQKTNEMAGDGTTTATVLAQSIFNRGLKFIAAGASAMDLKRGIDISVKTVVNSLKNLASPIGDSFENILHVATISANNDKEIGKYITDSIKSVSRDGVITIEESSSSETYIDVVEGMQFSKGFMSPLFMTDTVKGEVVLDNPFILLNTGAINLLQDLLPALNLAVEAKRPLLIISDEVGIDTLNALIINKIRGAVQVCVSKAPSYGESRKETMSDIGVLTGGMIFNKDIGNLLSEVNESKFGVADKVIVTSETTTIIGGKGNKKDIDSQIEAIRFKIENSSSVYDKERYQERLAKLAGGIGIIYVGGTSEVDMKERKDRFEDSLNATRAAIDEGIVPGGGVALLRCVNDLKQIKGRNEDEDLGIKIILLAIEEPFKQIIENAGLPVDLILNDVNKSENKNWGFNVYENRGEDFIECGIIDPVKVTRVALENSASIAGLLLTTPYVVSIIPNKERSNGN